METNEVLSRAGNDIYYMVYLSLLDPQGEQKEVTYVSMILKFFILYMI